MVKRKKILIEPRFQVQFMLRLAAWVSLATCITAAVVLGFLIAADKKSMGDFFFVTRQVGTHPIILNRTEIILPALALSLIVNLTLSLLFALYYSQRLAGPIWRLTQDMLRLARGEPIKIPFQLRKADELQEIAGAFDTLIKSLEKKEHGHRQ